MEKISKDVEIEGFRKGKVPLNIVKQRFGQNALNQTLDELIQSTSNEVIRKNNLKLAIKPKVDVKNFGEENVSFSRGISSNTQRTRSLLPCSTNLPWT